MNDLLVQDVNGILVVDSRLIAEELGIQHTSLKDTISKYKEKLESFIQAESSPVPGATPERLFIQKAPRNTDGTGGVTYYLLTEEQATFLMTLSSNTEQVVEAKFKLVQAFSKARKVITQQSETNKELLGLVQTLLTKINNMEEQMQTVQALPSFLNDAKGIKAVVQTAIDPNCPDLMMNAREFLESKERIFNTPLRMYSRILSKRAANFFRVSKYENPGKKKGKTSLRGKDLAYFEAAWESLLEDGTIIF